MLFGTEQNQLRLTALYKFYVSFLIKNLLMYVYSAYCIVTLENEEILNETI